MTKGTKLLDPFAAPAEGKGARKHKKEKKPKGKAKAKADPAAPATGLTKEQIKEVVQEAMAAAPAQNKGKKTTKGEGKGDWNKGKGDWKKGKGKKDLPPLPCFLHQLNRCGHTYGSNSNKGEPEKRCRFEHRPLANDEEKAKYREWKAAQDNPVAAALPGGDICYRWQKFGMCQLGTECRHAKSHTPENAPKDKDGNATTKGKKGKGKGKGRGKGKKGKGRGKKGGRW